MTRRMPTGMQTYQIGVMLAGTRHDSEMFDISAHIDRSLHLGENLTNIRSQLGISTRNRGMEQLHQHTAERQRFQGNAIVNGKNPSPNGYEP